jgi:hypothetical protein
MLPDSFFLWQRSFTEDDFLAMKIIPSHDKIPRPPHKAMKEPTKG